jgi:hypothetical protein
MPHLMLTSALLFALLAVVAIAIGACLGIARDLMLDEDEATDAGTTTAHDGPSHNGQVGLAEDFGLGLRHHAANFAQDSGRSSYRRG